MTAKIFSTRNRPFHQGPFPLGRLVRHEGPPDLSRVPPMQPVSFDRGDQPASLVNAMDEYQAMLDVICDGLINTVVSGCPDDRDERARHIKSFGYFQDAPMVGIGRLDASQMLAQPIRNPGIDRLAEELRTRQTQTLAVGIDAIMTDLRDSMTAPPRTIDGHTHTVVFLYDHGRDPTPDEPGYEWIAGAHPQRAALRGTETAVIIASYLRVLGYDAKAHTATSSDVDLNKLAVGAGLATVEDGALVNPFAGTRFQLAAVTTNFAMTVDAPLAPLAQQPKSARGPRHPFAKRRYADGAHPFETLKRVDTPTTYIDEARVARVPKRTDMFARAQFGDMGKANQDNTKNGYFAQKSPISAAIRRPSGALLLLQQGAPAAQVFEGARDAARNAEGIKAAAYFMGADAVGISRCPDWAWYSHDAVGAPITPTHPNAISLIIDQGFDTTEGSSGDDWIAVAQSMRAYLRFSLLGGVIGKQIRNLGYEARVHTNLDSEVLQPPLLLLSGLGEVSRIGEVIVNPFLGPRLKSGCITTTMPLRHDKPIDFGMQAFCESCNKCARECPSGAITAGPKLMFNGYEIWKSDSQKCITYRLTQQGGSMCGRCMKTCPWNMEGLQHEKPLRWIAMNVPAMAGVLARADDLVGNGRINPQKRWWWDLKVNAAGGYDPVAEPTNYRDLQPDLKLDYADQTLAVYPASLAPPPHPFPYPMDREKGIEAYQALITAQEYQARLAAGQTDGLAHTYLGQGDAPVVRVQVSQVTDLTTKIRKYELRALDDQPLPAWQAGAHLDVVVAPQFFRQFSLCGDPADRTRYELAVLREDAGRGGSALMHQLFTQGRKIFVSKPINHFPLAPDATRHMLMGGGIGITPMIAFAHECHHQGADFALHYSVSSDTQDGFADQLRAMPWADKVTVHNSATGTRADLDQVLAGYRPGWHVYACGPQAYMTAVTTAATRQGVPEDAQHIEYFTVPDVPVSENHGFTLRLARSGRELHVPADRAATDILTENGVAIDVKCSDGLCGVCKCGLIGGAVDHRDFVLSKRQRETSVILCQSRAATPGGVIEVDL
ncbi:4Fe-4S double cluster binding domain-containing protein [Roseobacter sp.]|uniref:4Fe-4S dicluster domain-containing protein n=1 Tax=Roseobacter sp. TaxID=1907202 RepID=UPI003297BCF4